VIVFRHADTRFPFLWEGPGQPPARWHAEGDPPTHYFSDTPDGAWAELLRHEEITESADLATIRRAMWAVEIEEPPAATPRLSRRALTGGERTYGACRAEARRLRAAGAGGFTAVSAALVAGGARGDRAAGGLRPGPARDGRTIALFGPRPDLVGWRAAAEGRPGVELIERVNYRR